LQLLRSIFCFRIIYHLEHTELLFDSVQPVVSLKWFFCFSKNRRLSIQEILIVAVLGRLRFLMDMVSDTLVQGTLTFGKHLQQLSTSRLRRRRWRFLIALTPTARAKLTRHLQVGETSKHRWCRKVTDELYKHDEEVVANYPNSNLKRRKYLDLRYWSSNKIGNDIQKKVYEKITHWCISIMDHD
jgi:hypothetical protein